MITDKQLDRLRRAVGWPRFYRNHFATTPGCDTWDDIQELVNSGLMKCYVEPKEGVWGFMK